MGHVRVKTVVVAVCLCGTLLAAVLFFRTRRPLPETAVIERTAISRNERVRVGGVDRPLTDIRVPAAPPVKDFHLGDYGQFPPVDANANEQVASVAQALREGTHPERLSILVAPAKFDLAAYLANPDEYVKRIEPGRIWETAKPGVGVPRLKSLVPRAAKVEQGEPLTLRVQAVKDAPITFVALDGGEFQNRLRTITVKANAEGQASVTFVGIPGTIDEVKVLAASPMASGQLQYFIRVLAPKSSVSMRP